MVSAGSNVHQVLFLFLGEVLFPAPQLLHPNEEQHRVHIRQRIPSKFSLDEVADALVGEVLFPVFHIVCFFCGGKDNQARPRDAKAVF